MIYLFESKMKTDNKTVKVKNISENELPEYETENSAGMDLRANASITIGAMERALVPTGLFIELPKGMEAQIRPRSGLALRNGITVLNSPGTIDADYRGEIGIILINLSDEPFKITTGERIAQIVFAKHETVTFQPSIELTETKRGKGGFGSTGKS